MSPLIVHSSPHLRHNDTTRGIMLDVIIALLPAAVAAFWLFGIRSLFMILVSVISAVLAEYISRRIMKRSITVGDLSAVVTGLLLAYNLPVSAPLWMAALGSAIAIVVVKQCFGGLGQNFMNPALAARIILMTSFPTLMTQWVVPFSYRTGDAVTGASPLALVEAGEQLPSLQAMLLGVRTGCIGETCAIALLAGGIYLVSRKVISPLIPIFYIGTTALVTWLCGANPLYQVLSGGLLLGAIFMATDYATSPLTRRGKIIYAIGCGLITALIRLFGSLPEGVSFSIVLMNVLVPHIERLTAPRPFGVQRSKKAKKAE